MKQILILMSCMILSACATHTPSASLKVSGMSCEACAMSVTNNLKKIDGVQDVQVDVSTGTVDIFTQENATINKVEVQKMIDLSGFKLDSMTVQK